MTGFLWNVLMFIIALGTLITFHELGHFWVARRNGVKVLRFCIGFGKPLWRRQGKDGTEYALAMIPLGGYVRMLDTRVDEVVEAERHLAFDQQPVWRRIAIVAAGPIANFVFAFVALWLMYLIGVQSIRPVIGEIAPDSIAAVAGLQGGAEIVAVDGRETPNWEAVNLALIRHIGADAVELQTRLAQAPAQTHQLDLSAWRFDPEKQSTFDSLGIAPFRPAILLQVAKVMTDGAAAAAGMREGDRIVAIDTVAVADWASFVEQIANAPGRMLSIEVEREGSSLRLDVVPQAREVDGQSRGFIGIVPVAEPWPESSIVELKYGILGSITAGWHKTVELVGLSVGMIGKLITGDVSLKNLSGPISIAQGAGDSAGYGLVYFLWFLALISVNLGVINLLPLPVLDGGHLLYFVVELIRGKPVPEKIQEIGFRIGSVLLILLMGVALMNDLGRL